jgi:hypothetical protein
MVHLIDADLLRAVRIPQSESVESGAKDHDLPNSTFDSPGQRIFRDPASRCGEQASDAAQGVCVRKWKDALLVFTQDLHGKRILKDRAVIQQLMSGALSGDHQGCAAGFIWLHVRGLPSRNLFPFWN